MGMDQYLVAKVTRANGETEEIEVAYWRRFDPVSYYFRRHIYAQHFEQYGRNMDDYLHRVNEGIVVSPSWVFDLYQMASAIIATAKGGKQAYDVVPDENDWEAYTNPGKINPTFASRLLPIDDDGAVFDTTYADNGVEYLDESYYHKLVLTVFQLSTVVAPNDTRQPSAPGIDLYDGDTLEYIYSESW